MKTSVLSKSLSIARQTLRLKKTTAFLVVMPALLLVSQSACFGLLIYSDLKLTGPTTLDKNGTPGTYTFTFTASGTEGPADLFLGFSVLDEDLVFDDTLRSLQNFGLTSAGTYSFTFELWCEDCDVRGAHGSSGEQEAEVYVNLARTAAGVPGSVGRSNVLDVKCVPDGGTTVAMLAVSLGGLTGMRRKSRRS